MTTGRRRNYWLLEQNFHTKKFIYKENLLVIEIKETEILINKPVFLGLSILELSNILMYEFWYDYVKRKYGKKVSLHAKKQIKSMKTFKKMLKLNLIFQITI